jgi:uncharacterized membrane protein (UPF0127 family)
MEALCRLSYSGGREMITTHPGGPATTCHDGRMRQVLIAAITILAVTSCSGGTNAVDVTPITAVTLQGSQGKVHVAVEEADTPDERERGLMGRTSLGADDGMVFLFDEASDGSFWMKVTRIPLSIAFWNEAGTIVGIRDMDPCTADPCPTYGSPEPYVGALEVNQGFFRDHEVTVGDPIDLS